MSYHDLTSVHTIGELRLRMDPNGMPATIAEVIDEVNEFDRDILWMEANDKTSHLFSRRLAYNTPQIRRFNYGTTPSKTTVGQAREILMMTEDWSEIDVKEARLSGNPAQYRMNEDVGFAEGFSQAVPGYFLYGDGQNEEILGLANRLAATTTTGVYSAGGTGTELSSIYICEWGVNLFGIYPTGSMAGLDYEDKGVVTSETAGGSGRRMDIFRSRWGWDFGLVNRDPRAIARVCNIDVRDPSAASPTDISNKLIYALNKMARGTRGRGTVAYCNSDTFTILDIIAKNKSNVFLNWTEKWGEPVMAFRDRIPIRQVDEILSNESSVS